VIDLNCKESSIGITEDLTLDERQTFSQTKEPRCSRILLHTGEYKDRQKKWIPPQEDRKGQTIEGDNVTSISINKQSNNHTNNKNITKQNPRILPEKHISIRVNMNLSNLLQLKKVILHTNTYINSYRPKKLELKELTSIVCKIDHGAHRQRQNYEPSNKRKFSF